MGGFGGGGGGYVAPAAPAPTPTPTPGPAAPMNVSDTGYGQQFIDVPTDGMPQTQYEYIKSGQSQGIPGMAGDDLDAVLGDGGNQQFFSPFSEGQRGATSFLGSQYNDAGGSLPNQTEFTVSNQNPSATGEGGFNFGSRLVGNTDGTVDMADPSGSIPQTDQVATQPSGDVNQPDLIAGPGEAILNDVNYRMATYGSPNGSGFVPGGRGATQAATGPMSRNLMSQRTGFGRKMS
jgi:hypothetical protein